MFSFRKPYFLGIDFGTSYIKAVELTVKNNAPVLVNYGQVEMGFTEGKNADRAEQTPERTMQEHLILLLERLRPKSESANFALPGFTGLVTLIELPDMEDAQLEQAVRFEAHKYIPSRLEDVAFSWEVVSRHEKAGKNIVEVLLVAALKKEVSKYERYISGTGLHIDVLELEIFPMVRAALGDRTEAVLLVDIGSRATNLVLVENGNVHVNRNLSAGGNEITSTLSDGLSISWKRAEELKREPRDFLNDPASSLVFPTLDLITSEMGRIFDAYAKTGPDRRVKEIVLSGGTAKMFGLARYLTGKFDAPVSIANPWHGIFFEEVLRNSLESMGPSFAIATGLALGGVERFRKNS